MKVADLKMNAPAASLEVQHKIRRPGQPSEKQAAGRINFHDVLENKLVTNKGLQFSAHAARRIEERQVGLSPQVLSRLDNGVRQVSEKGSRSSLIFVDETAYIISVKNKTVVTAVNKADAVNNVFTNIDSVAIV